MVGQLSRLAVLAVFLLLPPAHAAPGDYDGDGFSDLAVATVSRTNGTTTYAIRSMNGRTASIRFQSAADAFVPGNFFGENHVNPGIVTGPGGIGPLTWVLHRDQGEKEHIYFGLPGDTAVPADYDCDGKTDFASKSEDGLSAWRFILSSHQQIESFRFGERGNFVFGADIDGDRCAELFALRESGGGLYWAYRKLRDATIHQIPFGLVGDTPLRPFDINGDGLPDIIVVRPVNGRNIAYVRFSWESSQTYDVGPAGTVPMTGNFTGANGFAYFNRANGTFTIIEQDGSARDIPFGSETGIVIRPDGSSVRVGQDETPRPGDDPVDFPPYIPPGNNPPFTPSGPGFDRIKQGIYLCDRQVKRNDGQGGFVHNPNNSRRSIKAIYPNKFTGSIVYVHVGKNGKLIEQLYNVSPNEGGDRQRYYGRKNVRAYPKNFVYIATIFNGDQHCVTIPSPSRRYD